MRYELEAQLSKRKLHNNQHTNCTVKKSSVSYPEFEIGQIQDMLKITMTFSINLITKII